jgi:endonuclease VIII
VPEGDTIYRAARALDRALAGRTVSRFESVFPHLTRVDVDAPLRGRAVERVTSRGKHLLIWFSGNLVLRTHMRMNGSWHIYRPGERWRRPRHEMRIVIGAGDYEAVAFTVPVAEFVAASAVDRELADVGPDPLAADFDPSSAVSRLRARGEMEVAEALLDQSAIAGIGNIYKSEILFACGVNPFVRVADLPDDAVERVVAMAVRLMRANVVEGSSAAIVTYTGLRRTTGRSDSSARLWVYGRGGKPCRRCGTPVSHARQGAHARSTYWCDTCQPRSFCDPVVPKP